MFDSHASRLRRRRARIRRTGERQFGLAGLNFRDDETFLRKTSADEVILIKGLDFLDLYLEVLAAAPTRNILDIGIWQGGSALAFAALFDPKRLVAVDICEPVAPFEDILKSHPLGNRIRVHWRTAQDDAARLDQIIDTEFEGPIDLIVDDASHALDLTRRTFEITFPRLAPLGWYVIEDWAWAHLVNAPWRDQPAMTTLVTELLIANHCSPEVIARVDVRPKAVFIQKARTAPVGEPVALADLMRLHGRSITPL
jgi:predicted O-methyltransferase YrrM